MNREERITAMAQTMVAARQAQEDVGELLAAALQDAAKQLGNAESLVIGRPGSWEAEIVRRMAASGGIGNRERVQSLATLFVMMGQAKEDGGDVLSQAMGQAVDTLGGLSQFAEESDWFWDLVNIGRQYS